jgi:hypothetical protein
MGLRVGSSVLAVETIAEENFLGKANFVHAKRNDVGRVISIDQGCPTVLWKRTGTATVCHTSEIVQISDLRSDK